MNRLPYASAMLLLASWATASAQGPTPLEYYPLQIGHRWTYTHKDLKSGQQKTDQKRQVVIEVERTEDFVRNIKSKDGKEAQERLTGYLLKSTSGGKTTFNHVVVLEDGVYKVHEAGMVMSPPLLFLKRPPLSKWDCNSISGTATLKGTYTPKLDDIKTNAGAFPSALAISFRSDDKAVEVDTWYAPRVGMVKQRIKAKDHLIELELEKFEAGK